ncbi:hypothetical protein KBZ33_20815, partial [Cyanobium sp. Cruz-8D1]|nr:hypothetical protein [Cyanobium sp. Cruz-8H5]MCP9868691.1 hypothetical protein [Cyanobium sp. Cruz-8D1]
LCDSLLLVPEASLTHSCCEDCLTDHNRNHATIKCLVDFSKFPDVDSFLRSQGFTLLRFASSAGRPFKPLQIIDNRYQSISQLLWADAIYVRDFRKLELWSNHQLRTASFLLHQLYDAFDLTAFLLSELDRRCAISYSEPYLSALLLGNQTLGLSGL